MVRDRLLVHWWARLGVAVLLVAVGAVLRMTVFADTSGDVRFVTFYPMVILAALFGGLAAGLLATGLSVLVTLLWIQGEVPSFSDWRTVIVFVISCSAISLIAEYLRHASARAQRAEAEVRALNADLERRVELRTEELAAANAELESFAYSVSHDLRAPLRAIDGFSAVLMEDLGERLAEEDVEHLTRVRAAAQRMAALIEGLLTLARVSRRDLVRREVDLTRIAESTAETLREIDPERHVEVVVTPDMHACADEDLSRVVLGNLLGNAWKFTSAHAQARIECGVLGQGSESVFFVKDDGVGFDQEHVGHLFRPFERLHGTADGYEGEGIGLATVQRVLARHGGRIWAESEVGKGATFFFTLPDPEDSPSGPALPEESRSAVPR